MNRTTLYWTTNAAFWIVLALGSAIGSTDNANTFYLALLFAICSTSILNVRRINDRYALLAVFSLVYFHFYGTLDLIRLFSAASSAAVADGPISAAEFVILVGGALAQIGYRLTCRPTRESATPLAKDWPESTLVIAGCTLWCVATYFTWQLKVNVLVETTAAATARGLASLSAWETIGLLLANMLQPLAILILAYVHSRYRRAYMLPIVIAVVLFQLVMGFVIDVKGEALIGGVLVVVTKLMVDGKLPKVWIVAFVAFVAVAFPALQANRALRHQHRLDHSEVAQNVTEVAKQAFARREQATSGLARSETVFERTSLKGSVHMIVTRTGSDVNYQGGYTLMPILAAFIPKVIWPDKPSVQTGQLVNKEFRVSQSAYTYISPSHLGELYWNFGWLGVLIGLPLIGALLGFIGKRIDMSAGASITRLMVAAVTIRLLILGFESSIASPYVVWLRSIAAIGILHFLLAKTFAGASNQSIGASAAASENNRAVPAFPNLMR